MLRVGLVILLCKRPPGLLLAQLSALSEFAFPGLCWELPRLLLVAVELDLTCGWVLCPFHPTAPCLGEVCGPHGPCSLPTHPRGVGVQN